MKNRNIYSTFILAIALISTPTWAAHDGSPPIGEVDALSISKSIDLFGIRYFKTVSEKAGPKENVMSSGINIARLLLTAAMTNDEKEQNNILKPIFGRNLNAKEIEAVYQELPKLLNRLALDEKDMKVALETALFTRNLSVEEREEMKKLIHGEVSNELSRKRINAWVASKTNDLIKELLTQEPQGDTLVSTLYFKLPWHTPFKADRTRNGKFTPSGGAPYDVQMMHGKVAAPYYESTDYKFLSLPFKPSADKSKQYHCDFYLPQEGKDFDAVFKDLQSGEWKTKLKSAEADLATRLGSDDHQTQESAEVALGVSKVDIKTTTPDPKGVLKSLGLDRLKLMGSDAADVIEKGAFRLNEEGGEGAMAAAVVSKGFSLKGREFSTERPYIMVIRNQDNEIISLVKMNKPNEAPPPAPAN